MARAATTLRRPRWPLAGVPLVIAVLAIATGALLDRELAERAERQQAERADVVVETLAGRVDAYTSILFAVRAFFDATRERPTRAAFARYIEGLRVARRFPGAQVVGFAERVDREGLPAFTARVNADARASDLGYPRFEPHPDTGEDELVVVSYLAPLEGNERAFGLDFLSEPTRRDAVISTRYTGMPVATGPLTLVQDDEPRPGFLIHLATPTGGSAFDGTAYAGFRVEDLVRLALADEVRSGDIEIRDAGAMVFDSDPETDARRGERLRMDVLGRDWEVASRLAEDTVSSRAIGWIVAVIGIALAAVAALLLRSLTTTEARARALAAQMTRDLADSNAELERFAYVASHDLQEPLRSVTGFVGLLSRHYGDRLDERGRGYLSHIERGSARMRALVTDLLEYSRLQAVPAQPCDLGAAWAQACDNLGGAIADAGATVTADPLPTVLADPARMVQVFQNLVSNAIRYGGRRVHASARRDGNAWEVAVRDDGPGIDPRYHEKIFELFERLDARSGVEGTGMGLSICKRAIERFGGRMWVESVPGEGATFRFTLPAA